MVARADPPQGGSEPCHIHLCVKLGIEARHVCLQEALISLQVLVLPHSIVVWVDLVYDRRDMLIDELEEPESIQSVLVPINIHDDFLVQVPQFGVILNSLLGSSNAL